ncbi:MAG: hypothetical protein ACI8Z1_001704 [Candidatus Azotimanducaceae bacterium]|jgi:hypothetical protein
MVTGELITKKQFQTTTFLLSVIALAGCGNDEIVESVQSVAPVSKSVPPKAMILRNVYFVRVTHQHNGNDVHNIFAVKDDGTGLSQLTTSPADGEYDNQSPAISPDGTRIAFMTMRR